MPRVCPARVLASCALLLAGVRADPRDHDFHFIEDKAQLLDTLSDLHDPLAELCAGVQCAGGARCEVAPGGGARCGRGGGGGAGSHNERRRARDDEVYYEWNENDITKDKHKDNCVSCPRGGAPVCGSDGRSYGSLCRLDLRNCRRRARPPVRPLCRRACPCAARAVEAPPCSARSLADRLLDWFSVVMAAEGGSPPPPTGFPRDCKPEVRWMFAHLDTDADGVLSQDNLYALRHDDREACLRPFLTRCGRVTSHGKPARSRPGGLSRAGLSRAGPAGLSRAGPAGLSRAAWCGCLRGAARPCRALARAHPKPPPGSYVPSCDSAGFYRARQCHPALGVCWCVSPHGEERRGTRGAGRASCGGGGDDDEDGEGDDGDSGSGDRGELD